MKEEFKEQQKDGISDYIAFCRVIAGRRFKRDYISKWLKQLVDMSDYSHADISAILDHLVILSNSEIK